MFYPKACNELLLWSLKINLPTLYNVIINIVSILIMFLLQAAQPASIPSAPHRGEAEHSSMVEASREGFLRPASCSGRDAATRHHGLQSVVSFTWRPGDAFFFFFCGLRLSGGTLNIRAHTWGDTSTLEYSKNLPFLLGTAETHHVPQIYMAIYKTVLCCLGAWQVTLNFVFSTKSTMCTHITGLDPLPPGA